MGYLDEAWFSRIAQPRASAWTDAASPFSLQEKPLARNDTAAKAVACYGLFVPDREQMLVRFAQGQPISRATCAYLAWLAKTLATSDPSLRVLVLFWDNASWHISREVRDWVRCHNRGARQSRGLRFLICRLPTKSPWLNRIEPKWVHGKRAICEPVRVLSLSEVAQRLCDYYRCENLQMLESG